MPVEHLQTLCEMESVKQGISFPRLGALGDFQAEIQGTGEIKLFVTTRNVPPQSAKCSKLHRINPSFYFLCKSMKGK